MKKIILLLMTILFMGGCSLYQEEEHESSFFKPDEFETSFLEFKGLYPQDGHYANNSQPFDMGKRLLQVVYNTERFQHIDTADNEQFKNLVNTLNIEKAHLLFSEKEEINIFLAEIDNAAETKKAFFDKNKLEELKSEFEQTFNYYNIKIDYTFRTKANAENILLFTISGKEGSSMEAYNGYIMFVLEDDEKQVIVFGMAPKKDNKRIEIEKIASRFLFH